MMKRIFFSTAAIVLACCLSGWGFFAHQKINRLAVFSLPPEMIVFYKKHIRYLTEKAVNPDKRRYINPLEAPRHYIDLDVYGDSAFFTMPRHWKAAVERYSEDTLNAYGIVPWHIYHVYFRLKKAFLERDAEKILKCSADLGHYVADAHVPLHTTENYNGQFTGQHGIHGFWESRLPELFYEDYDLFAGKASYVNNVQMEAWEAVKSAHLALDSVLGFERKLSEKYPEDKKYSFEERGSTTVRVYSLEYSRDYHDMLDGMVERQLLRSVRMVANIWYTAWVDGGQPDLAALADPLLIEEVIDSAHHHNPMKDHERRK